MLSEKVKKEIILQADKKRISLYAWQWQAVSSECRADL